MFDIPYILLNTLEIDNIIVALLSFMFASMVNAEAQNYVSMFFGNDIRRGKRAFSFNPLLHFDLPSLVCFVFLGFGWSRRIDIDYEKVKKGYHFFIIKMAGSIANFLFANIVSSIIYMLGKISKSLANEKVLNILLITNLSFCVYNLLLPIPPFSMGKALSNFFLLEDYKENENKIYLIGIVLCMFLFFFDYFILHKVISNNINELIKILYKILI